MKRVARLLILFVFAAVSYPALAFADPSDPPVVPDDGSGDRQCACNDGFCQDTGGGSGFRYCCHGTGSSRECGCTIFVVC